MRSGIALARSRSCNRAIAGTMLLAAAMLLAMPAKAQPITWDFDETDDSAEDGAGEPPPEGFVLPQQIRIERDLAYGADAMQRLDVYHPADKAQHTHMHPRPILVMVHGGAWMAGDKAMPRVITAKADHWLPMGYVVVSVNYRLAPQADVLQQAEDIAAALAFVQAHAESWHADPARLLLVGHSAGAHLAALVASDPELAARHELTPWAGTIALDSAALDVARIMQRRHYRFYDRVFKADPALWHAASPIERLTRPPAPMLLVCSTRREDSCPPARDFAAKARQLGGRASVLPVALSHRQINETLGEKSRYTDAVEAFSRTLGLP